MSHAAGLVALCLGQGGVAGACTGLTPALIIAKVQGDALAAAATNGYTNANPARDYGSMAFAGGY